MRRIIAGFMLFATAALFGCGGGGGTATQTVSGTASQGAAVAAGTILTLTDSNGSTATGTVGNNGAYSIDVTNLTAPFVIKVGNLYSYASGAGTTNINPFTTLCIQLAQNSTTVSTTLPSGFATQFTAAVNNLKTALSGLYPTNVTASTDFLNGSVTIGAGVDKVFDTTVITAPSGGVYSITVNGHQVVSGTVSSSSITATPNSSAIVNVSTMIFPPVFTTVMLSSKTFNFSDTGGAAGSITFNADGTTSGRVGTWTINASGQLVVHITSSGNIATFTLTGTTSTTITASESVSNGGAYTATFTTPFTTAMLSGKNFNYSDTGGAAGSITFNADGTTSGRVGTWTINASGQLVFNSTSTGNTATFTLTGMTSTTITASESVSNGGAYTATFTAA